jgi:NAD(P)-dependent dehydrogenase (short-subunit alcohol dehydrogenase family)
MGFEDRVVLVTGAARGIGRAIAEAFSREGARVVINDVCPREDLEKVAKNFSTPDTPCLAIRADVGLFSRVTQMIGRIEKEFQRLDILVNNAGIFGAAPLAEMSTETWDNIINTHLRAAFLCSRAAFRIMKAQGGGRIINIGSISALRVRENNAPYNTAKAALVGLTQSVALEGRGFNINCGILHPGLVRRDIPFPGGGDQPMMEPEEIAAAAVYMAGQPDHINVLELVQLPREQPYLGRG